MELPKRTIAQSWVTDLPSEDTAPPERPQAPKPEDWGVTVDEARAMLERQTCPVCGEGPWKSPLNHVARKHGIDRLTMRDVCHMSTRDTVTDPSLREKNVERGRRLLDSERARGMSDVSDRRKARRTNAARKSSAENLQRWLEENPEEIARLRAEFRDRMTTPEALERWHASVKSANAGREYTDEEKAAFVAWINTPEAQAKREAYNDARRIDICQVDGCGRPHLAKGLCKRHYRTARP